MQGPKEVKACSGRRTLMALGRSLISASHGMLHHDFCPAANRYVYWLRHPLACLAVAAAVAGICGALVNPSALVLLAVLAGITALGLVWPAVAVRGLECDLSFSLPRVRIGEAVTVRLTIHNRSPWPVWGLSLRQGFARGENPEDGVALARIAGWSRTELDWTFVPRERGVFPFSAPHLDTGFPFGLLHATAPVRVFSELLVWPRSVALDAMPDAVESQSRENQLADRRTGDLGDLLGTRSFRAGDSLRRVHWRQTARHGRLIVTERQSPSSCAVHLTVDIANSSHRSCGAACTLETTLSLAASVIESLHRGHAYVECVVGDKRFGIGESQAELRQALDALARVPRHGAECPALKPRSSAGPVRHLTSLRITGDVAANTLGKTLRERLLIVSSPAAAGDPQRAVLETSWLEVTSNECLEAVLPERWRRACLVR
jgi:uncharacterized protein (DUF58 family)